MEAPEMLGLSLAKGHRQPFSSATTSRSIIPERMIALPTFGANSILSTGLRADSVCLLRSAKALPFCLY